MRCHVVDQRLSVEINVRPRGPEHDAGAGHARHRDGPAGILGREHDVAQEIVVGAISGRVHTERGAETGEGDNARTGRRRQQRIGEIALRCDAGRQAKVQLASGNHLKRAAARQHDAVRRRARRVGQVAAGADLRDVVRAEVEAAVVEVDEVSPGVDQGGLRERRIERNDVAARDDRRRHRVADVLGCLRGWRVRERIIRCSQLPRRAVGEHDGSADRTRIDVPRRVERELAPRCRFGGEQAAQVDVGAVGRHVDGRRQVAGAAGRRGGPTNGIARSPSTSLNETPPPALDRLSAEVGLYRV